MDFKLKGKGFPAYESFIEDQKGVRISISTYGVNNKNQILKLIRVDDGEWIRSAESSIIVPLDKEGNFTNVIKLPENTYISMDGQKTEYTISEWNDRIKNKKAANDRNDNTTNTNTTNNKK